MLTSTAKPRLKLFKWRHFEPEIILLCLRWYLRYSLSYRDLEEMMAERGLFVVCNNSSVHRKGVMQHRYPRNSSHGRPLAVHPGSQQRFGLMAWLLSFPKVGLEAPESAG